MSNFNGLGTFFINKLSEKKKNNLVLVINNNKKLFVLLSYAVHVHGLTVYGSHDSML